MKAEVGKQIPMRKRISVVVEKDNMKILRCSAIWKCIRSTSVSDLSAEFGKGNLQGFSIMRVSSMMTLLMFSYVEARRKILDSHVLLQWFEYGVDWSPDKKMESRHVWLSVSGVSMQAWPRDSFINIARTWGSFSI
ncbi:hypothetical protein V6N13_098612 [Hibiscus sabdariffa]|uniref:DUF4283 domain-containing protein n=1 Tax=Hibiscus sabdariffa TaxID=183260 RepID=A0ABR2EED5_9ROSI